MNTQKIFLIEDKVIAFHYLNQPVSYEGAVVDYIPTYVSVEIGEDPRPSIPPNDLTAARAEGERWNESRADTKTIGTATREDVEDFWNSKLPWPDEDSATDWSDAEIAAGNTDKVCRQLIRAIFDLKNACIAANWQTVRAAAYTDVTSGDIPT